MNPLLEYIKNNKITKSRLASEIKDERGEKLPTRDAFVLLRKYAGDFFQKGKHPRMIALSGLRGVGKTTLMWQTANYVYNNHTTNIYFISIDDLNRLEANLFDIINIFEKEIFKCSLNSLKESFMLLIDEVHETEGWQKDLKILYEKGKKIFVIATGSSALLLHSSSDLASRWTVIKIFPFSFSEFILVKSWFEKSEKIIFPPRELTNKLNSYIFFSEKYPDIKSKIKRISNTIKTYLDTSEIVLGKNVTYLIDEYISYHNIARFLPISNRTLIIERVLGLFDRILFKDISIPGIEYYETINRILFRLVLSDEINFQSLSKDFRIKEKEIEKIIVSLNNAEILNVFLPYGGIKSRTGISKKVFFMSPSLRHALYSRIYGEKLHSLLKAKLYEDIVAMYLKRNLSEGMISYGYGGGKNPDFVIESLDLPVLLEIGIGKFKNGQIKAFGNYRYGVLINSKINQPEFNDNRRVIYLPLSWFLLL